MARRRFARPDPFAPRRLPGMEPPTAPQAMALRSARVSFTPTPPMYAHPTREFYRRNERPPFPQALPTMLQGFGAPAGDDLAREGQKLAQRGHCREASERLEAARRAGSGLVLEYAQEIYNEVCPLSPRGASFAQLPRRRTKRRR